MEASFNIAIMRRNMFNLEEGLSLAASSNGGVCKEHIFDGRHSICHSGLHYFKQAEQKVRDKADSGKTEQYDRYSRGQHRAESIRRGRMEST